MAELTSGRLSSSDARELRQHLDGCVSCRVTVAELVRGTRPAALESDQLPTMTDGRFTMREEYAHGGLGAVFRAHDERLGREVAIKQLLAPNPDAERRFRREALITARLQHPAIVPVYEAGRWPSGEPFYAMRLVAGKPLATLITDAKTLDERLALLPRMITVAEAVAYAHSQGVLHRDLKPANVIVGDYGETVVIDWGLAKEMHAPDDDAPRPAEEQEGVTIAGTVMGTPAYMPPEQALGHTVDERADVYAMGAMLYHLLAGNPPYRGTSREVLERVVAVPPPPLDEVQKGVPPDLTAIVNKAMERDPALRYGDGGAFAGDLRRFLDGQLVAAHRYSRAALFTRWLSRHRVPVTLSTIFALMLTGLGTVAVLRVIRERNRAESRSNELILAGARATLDRNPTATLAWLKDYPLDGVGWPEARSLALEALGRGVARQLLWPLDPPSSPSLSPDGTRYATQGATAQIEIRDLSSGRVLRTLPEKDGSCWRVKWSPDGRRIVCDNADARVYEVWDLESGTRRAIPFTMGYSSNERFSPDGTHLATGGRKQIVRILDLTDGSAVDLGKLSDDVSDIRYSNDGSELITAAGNGDVSIFTLATGARRELIKANVGLVQDGALSPDGKKLALVGERLELIDLAGGPTLRPPGDATPARRIGFSPDGSLIAYGAVDNILRLWDWRRGTVRNLVGHEAPLNGFAFSPDGTRIASASRDATLRVWSLASGDSEILRGHGSQAVEVWFARDGQSVLSISADESTRVWSVPDTRLAAYRVHLGESRALELLDGTHAVTAGWEDGSLRLTDLESGTVKTLAHAAGSGASRILFSADHDLVASQGGDGAVLLWRRSTGESRRIAIAGLQLWLVALSSDGKTAITDARDKQIRLWDTAKTTFTILGHEIGGSGRGALSPDGRTLITQGDDNTLRIWDLAGGGAPRTMSGQKSIVRSYTFSSDGKRLLTTSVGDNDVRLWDLAGGTFRILGTHHTSLVNVAVSRDRTWAASADFHGEVKLWTLDGQHGRTLSGHTSFVNALDFSPDGKWLVSGSADRTLRLWDVATGAQLEAIAAGDTIVRVVFLPDGKRIVTVDNTGMMRLWRVEPKAPATSDRKALHDWLAAQTAVVVRPDRTLGSP